ncbi:amino acid deaminase/aldolase [Actinosynnema mirum]|uniref:Alanine racemase domain protein n=1 Tax=Actinosynnema mirum (strain ATCC 29888 / DSM 43827 / JCM 3225 / NBRC 14064 / NCIMB 13271 / NRRL B-12336 / IMRU 3971 / 101) TaxID=446462 RepID=C6WCI4_ACTMD|nr:amino acid deaminase/aldolase [Actinosynnema mirum]ACU34005.1 alanine racemase domain protein [Actinosynnema mirum DSM 43827]
MQPRTRLDLATKDLEAPLAIVDLDAFDHNAADLVRRAGGKPIRVASKSVRVRALLDRVLARPGYAGLMCYSLPEALWLSSCDTAEDLLVAYPTVDHAALRALAADKKARGRVTIMVDSTAHLDLVDAALGEDHPEIRVCLELDVSWRPLPGLHVGPRRSPVHTEGDAVRLARAVVARKGFRLVGVMAYEGQVAGIGDAPAGRRAWGLAVRWMQGRSVPELTERRAAAVAAVRRVADLEFVNGGGTGSLETTGADRSVTELAAGSGLVGPTLFDAYRAFSPRPAALFALPVVRRPKKNVATLFAGGYVASGTGTPDRLPSPHLPSGLELIGLEGAGEVQTPVVGKAADRLELGDRVWLRHAKAGELAERFAEYHLVSGDRVEAVVPTYRGEGKAFG